MKTSIAIRDVDEDVFRKFRAYTVEKHVKLGDEITRALTMYLSQQKAKKKQKLHHLDDIQPSSFGKGTENLSQNVKKELYGDRS